MNITTELHISLQFIKETSAGALGNKKLWYWFNHARSFLFLPIASIVFTYSLLKFTPELLQTHCHSSLPANFAKCMNGDRMQQWDIEGIAGWVERRLTFVALPLRRGRGFKSTALPWILYCEEPCERFCLAFRTDLRVNPSTFSVGVVTVGEDISLPTEFNPAPGHLAGAAFSGSPRTEDGR